MLVSIYLSNAYIDAAKGMPCHLMLDSNIASGR